ncbi:hypothetical protein [Mucilaginibacter myungsuensis]|uniref:hypothetical protein n=1 Tax=Mucilaginibacter myungsuensis TaxID=649104 RepID=UPI0025B4FA72|nr:hypothetical protein [Mucilaginibacter myungsuensis]
MTVAHSADGTWQFLAANPSTDNATVVTLEHIIQRDNTLNQVFDLEYGEMARREHIGGPWTREKFEEEDEEEDDEI